MTQKAEAGDVRAGVDMRAGGNSLRRCRIQRGHGVQQPLILLRRHQISFGGGSQHAGADGLCKNQRVPRLRAHVPQHPVWMDIPGDAEAVFRLVVLNRVAPGNDAARLHRLLVSALQNAADNLLRQRAGHAQKVHGHSRSPAHGVHIAEGVGGGDLSEPEGIIHNGRKEIHGMNGRDLISNAVHTGIVIGVEAHQQIRVAAVRQALENIR